MKLFEVIHILYGTAIISRENQKWSILLRVLYLCEAIDDVKRTAVTSRGFEGFCI